MALYEIFDNLYSHIIATLILLENSRLAGYFIEEISDESSFLASPGSNYDYAGLLYLASISHFRQDRCSI